MAKSPEELKAMLSTWLEELNAGIDEMDVQELEQYKTQEERNAFIEGSKTTLTAVLHEL